CASHQEQRLLVVEQKIDPFAVARRVDMPGILEGKQCPLCVPMATVLADRELHALCERVDIVHVIEIGETEKGRGCKSSRRRHGKNLFGRTPLTTVQFRLSK